MNPWVSRIVVLALFAGVLLLPLLWGGPVEGDKGAGVSGGVGGGGGEARQLIIISPHNAQIRYEIGRAFDQWHRGAYGEPVEIAWRSLGGTGDIHRILASTYRRLAEAGVEDMFSGYDMAFGGGDYFFDRQLKPGITVEVDGEEKAISLTEPVEIDPELLAAAYPEARIAGNKLYDPEGHWYGIVLSSFGIVYNRDWLEVMGEPAPETWSDIATRAYLGKLALADPSHSGSVRVTYNAILQRYGFERGLWTLRRMFANARYFAPGSTKVPTDVSYGEAAAGVAIDFYGRYQSQVVGGGERVGFVAPAGATVVTADPIAVLRGARHKETAERLIEFLLTEEGQAVWSFAKGDPMGPEKFELRRAPIRRDMYEKYGDRLVDEVNPWDIAEPLPEGTPSYFSVVPPVLHAMSMDIHGEAKAAWRAIGEVEAASASAGPGPRGEELTELHRRMVETFDATPVVDLLDLVRALPEAGPGPADRSGGEPVSEEAEAWMHEHGEAWARVAWAMEQLEVSPAVEAAWRKTEGEYEEGRGGLIETVAAMGPAARTIDFHTTIRTIRGPVWKRYERAEIKDRLAWTKFFRARYAEVVELGRGVGAE